MSDVRRVVFLIHPNITDFENKEKSTQWQTTVYTTALKILTQFESTSDLPLTWSEKGNNISSTEITKNLQWGHKFVHKSGIKFHTASDLRPLTEENFVCFQEELKYNDEEENKSDFFAHTLADNLIAVAHDFKWEQHEIVSPVKQVWKKGFRANRKRNRLSGQIKNLPETSGKNFIFIIGPLPKTKDDLNGYFEWNISDVNDITNVLMPTHLATHFRDKHDIRFFWLDSDPDTNKESCSTEEAKLQGISLMEQFLNANNGCVIPISLLAKNNLNEKIPRNSCLSSKLNLLSTTSESNCLNNTILNDSVFEITSKPFRNISEYSIIARRLENKNADLSKSNYHCFMTYQYEDSNTFLLNFTHLSLRTNNLQPFNLFHKLTSQVWEEYNSEIICQIQLNNNYHSTNSLNFKIPQVDQKMPEIITNTENINFVVLGYQYAHLLPMLRYNGLSLIGSQQENCKAFQSMVEKAHQENKVYIVRSPCALCDPSFQQCCCVHLRIGIFHPITNGCAAISWIIEPQRHGLAALMASCQKFVPHPVDLSIFLPQCYQEFTSSKLKENGKVAENVDKSFGEFVSFEPEMVEPWFANAKVSSQFQELCNDLKSQTVIPVTENNSEYLEFNDLIISQLQSDYKALPSDKSKKELTSEEKSYKPFELPNYNDPKLAIEAVMFEYQSSLDRFSNEPTLMKLSAREIIQSFCRISDKESTISFDKIEDLLMKNVFVSAAKIRGKDETQEKKTAEYFMQILLKFEWLSYKLPLSEDPDEFILDESEIIIQLLRSISISESPEKMKKFLNEDLVGSYSSVCGRVLYEIHSDLMLPIPSSLEQYSSEAGVDDSFFAPPSNKNDLPSMGPFSMASSIGSHCSDDLRPNKQFKLRRTSHINSTVTRNIVMPEPKKTLNRHRSKTVDTSKSRFQLSTRNKLLPEKSSQPEQTEKKLVKNVSQEVVRVRRDLFASPSKSARRKLASEADMVRLKKNTKAAAGNESKSGEDGRRRVLSVLDTPVAKQRMTALARQRFRMRKSHDSKEGGEAVSVIEESPMKFESENVEELQQVNNTLNTKPKSPRHSVMLTRRHSFYRGSDPKSRTVARAEVVQQHQLAHPPTPRIVHPKLASTKSSSLNTTFSPKSLLFSYSGQKSGEKSAGAKRDPPQKGRRRLQLLNSNETEDSNKTKFMFQKSTASDKTQTEPEKSELKKPETLSSSVFAAYKTETNANNRISNSENVETNVETLSCVNGPDSAIPEIPSPVSKNKPKPEELVTPDNSPKKGQDSLPSLIQQVGPLDNYISRTPTPNKHRKLSTSVSSKRKPSPNGDHIHCWPRRKRPVDGSSSPGIFAKRSKKEIGFKTDDLFFNEDTILPDEDSNLLNIPKSNNLIESPDLGVYIVSDENNSNLKISKLPPADGDLSPGIDVEQYVNDLDNKTPSKKTDLLSDIGVYPITEPQSLPNLTRFKHREGTLFHARLGSPTSKKHLPMMLLCDHLNENNA